MEHELLYTKESLIEKLREIREMGWVRSGRARSNVGAVGNTLEDLLGIEENNLPLANGGTWELKAQRAHTTSLVTLFHNEPEPRERRIVPRILLPKYGWPHQSIPGEMSFRSTTPGDTYTDRGFRVVVARDEEKVLFEFNSTRVSSRHAQWLQEVVRRAGLGPIDPQPYWTFEVLSNKAREKLKNTFFVVADVSRREGIEYFHYNTAWLLAGFDFDKFLGAFEEGYLYIDFDARTGHNHGTKFRVRQEKWYKFFDVNTRIF